MKIHNNIFENIYKIWFVVLRDVSVINKKIITPATKATPLFQIQNYDQRCQKIQHMSGLIYFDENRETRTK